ncbi:hypothetical protein THRCLA_22756 [Thraustotheca clavata]|uniref:Uncharacterized protein n=1 Tax=Thraustotheca clavata TaxID=74557 RepID=A0A1V9YU01_9STRA|nr:hypothetical protein THRCLA_22756 [Thraustotheca clavata]
MTRGSRAQVELSGLSGKARMDIIRRELNRAKGTTTMLAKAKLMVRTFKRSAKPSMQCKHHEFLLGQKDRIHDILRRVREKIDANDIPFYFTFEDKDPLDDPRHDPLGRMVDKMYWLHQSYPCFAAIGHEAKDIIDDWDRLGVFDNEMFNDDDGDMENYAILCCDATELDREAEQHRKSCSTKSSSKTDTFYKHIEKTGSKFSIILSDTIRPKFSSQGFQLETLRKLCQHVATFKVDDAIRHFNIATRKRRLFEERCVIKVQTKWRCYRLGRTKMMTLFKQLQLTYPTKQLTPQVHLQLSSTPLIEKLAPPQTEETKILRQEVPVIPKAQSPVKESTKSQIRQVPPNSPKVRRKQSMQRSNTKSARPSKRAEISTSVPRSKSHETFDYTKPLITSKSHYSLNAERYSSQSITSSDTNFTPQLNHDVKMPLREETELTTNTLTEEAIDEAPTLQNSNSQQDEVMPQETIAVDIPIPNAKETSSNQIPLESTPITEIPAISVYDVKEEFIMSDPTPAHVNQEPTDESNINPLVEPVVDEKQLSPSKPEQSNGLRRLFFVGGNRLRLLDTMPVPSLATTCGPFTAPEDASVDTAPMTPMYEICRKASISLESQSVALASCAPFRELSAFEQQSSFHAVSIYMPKVDVIDTTTNGIDMNHSMNHPQSNEGTRQSHKNSDTNDEKIKQAHHNDESALKVDEINSSEYVQVQRHHSRKVNDTIKLPLLQGQAARINEEYSPRSASILRATTSYSTNKPMRFGLSQCSIINGS